MPNFYWGKTLSGFVALGTLIGMGIITYDHFQTDAEAALSHEFLAEWSEQKALENELRLTVLEINYILEMEQRDAQDENRLEYLGVKRINLENRLREIQGN